MGKRFLSIWFYHLKTDWMIHFHPELKNEPFVLVLPDHGRLRITEASAVAKMNGIENGMVVADAKVALPSLTVLNDEPGLSDKLLRKLCFWSLRYTPVCNIDPPDGLILDVTGCTHLWGDEKRYLESISHTIGQLGYHIHAALAGTIGTAWALARYAGPQVIVAPGDEASALMALPPAALRLRGEIEECLQKIGFSQVGSFMGMQRSALRRRFGEQLLLRLDQALGKKEELLEPLVPPEPFTERLPCLEPIRTATGIEIALHNLLQSICNRLRLEGKGVRDAVLKCYRVDNKTESISVSTNHPSQNPDHLFKLFEYKICRIEPALGIELFLLQASRVEDVNPVQESLWSSSATNECREIAELLDRIETKMEYDCIHRFLPDQHHMPERSVKQAISLTEKPAIPWRTDKPRPILLFEKPQSIEVTAPIPDYPPMNFRYKGILHKVKKADGPERIEPEWWLQEGQHRDYYVVEDEAGKRYWLFRSGHYDGEQKPSWFIHGLFA